VHSYSLGSEYKHSTQAVFLIVARGTMTRGDTLCFVPDGGRLYSSKVL